MKFGIETTLHCERRRPPGDLVTLPWRRDALFWRWPFKLTMLLDSFAMLTLAMLAYARIRPVAGSTTHSSTRLGRFSPRMAALPLASDFHVADLVVGVVGARRCCGQEPQHLKFEVVFLACLSGQEFDYHVAVDWQANVGRCRQAQ